MRNTERVFAANGYQIVQAKLLPIGFKFLNMIHIFEWIRPRRSQNRATPWKDARDGEVCQRLGISMDQAGPSILDTQDVITKAVCSPNDRSNDGVKTWTIPAAR